MVCTFFCSWHLFHPPHKKILIMCLKDCARCAYKHKNVLKFFSIICLENQCINGCIIPKIATVESIHLVIEVWFLAAFYPYPSKPPTNTLKTPLAASGHPHHLFYTPFPLPHKHNTLTNNMKKGRHPIIRSIYPYSAAYQYLIHKNSSFLILSSLADTVTIPRLTFSAPAVSKGT